MALGDQQIGPSIVVVIEEANTPAAVQQRHARQAGKIRVVGKRGVAAVAIQGILLVGQVRNDEPRPPIVR